MEQPSIADMKFETALAELERIVAEMEGGQLELAAAIAAHRRGMALMQHCRTMLADAEEQIRVVENEMSRAPDAPGNGKS